jgi:hypothetical protein
VQNLFSVFFSLTFSFSGFWYISIKKITHIWPYVPAQRKTKKIVHDVSWVEKRLKLKYAQRMKKGHENALRRGEKRGKGGKNNA